MARIKGTHKYPHEATAVQRVLPHPGWGILRSGRLYHQIKIQTGRRLDEWSTTPPKKSWTSRVKASGQLYHQEKSWSHNQPSTLHLHVP